MLVYVLMQWVYSDTLFLWGQVGELMLLQETDFAFLYIIAINFLTTLLFSPTLLFQLGECISFPLVILQTKEFTNVLHADNNQVRVTPVVPPALLR